MLTFDLDVVSCEGRSVESTEEKGSYLIFLVIFGWNGDLYMVISLIIRFVYGCSCKVSDKNFKVSMGDLDIYQHLFIPYRSDYVFVCVASFDLVG